MVLQFAVKMAMDMMMTQPGSGRARDGFGRPRHPAGR